MCPHSCTRKGLAVDCPGLGEIIVDVAYGGNFYAIVDAQERFSDIADYSAGQLIALSGPLRRALNERYEFVHPEKAEIKGLSHILWTGRPTVNGAHARNAVFYGDKAIDRSPCGTGTSARIAQWAAKGKAQSRRRFHPREHHRLAVQGRVESATTVGDRSAVVPSIAGWARLTGYNTIFIDDPRPLRKGFHCRVTVDRRTQKSRLRGRSQPGQHLGQSIS